MSNLRILVVGDPHAAVEDLEDCGRLMARVEDVVEAENPVAVVFLGDQHHTHAVVRVEVLDFWSRHIAHFKSRFPEVRFMMLVGNHDRSHDSSVTANTLRYDAEIIDMPLMPWQGVHLIPWQATEAEFLSSFPKHQKVATVICHQTFSGSKYENGFYASDGINPDNVPADGIISGHIHAPQMFGKVWYPGAPRWRIATDANTDRAIWVVEFDASGREVLRKAFTTVGYCRALYHVVDVEGNALQPEGFPAPSRVTVDIHGSAEYVSTRQTFWAGLGAATRCFPTRASTSRVRESEGLTTALRKHVESWKPKMGTDTEVLKKMVAERINV